MLSVKQTLPLVTTVVGTHMACTLASVFRGGIPTPRMKPIMDQSESFDAKHYDLVTDFVGRLYSGRKNSFKGVVLSPEATFEDPAAVCVGPAEIQEAFRILNNHLQPVSISHPRCIDVQPQGSSIRLTLLLHQKYTLGGYSIQLRSLLLVTVELAQRKDLPESDFLIQELKELWHGNPLLWPYSLFYVPRRLNGILSYWVTSRFL